MAVCQTKNINHKGTASQLRQRLKEHFDGDANTKDGQQPQRNDAQLDMSNADPPNGDHTDTADSSTNAKSRHLRANFENGEAFSQQDGVQTGSATGQFNGSNDSNKRRRRSNSPAREGTHSANDTMQFNEGQDGSGFELQDTTTANRCDDTVTGSAAQIDKDDDNGLDRQQGTRSTSASTNYVRHKNHGKPRAQMHTGPASQSMP